MADTSKNKVKYNPFEKVSRSSEAEPIVSLYPHPENFAQAAYAAPDMTGRLAKVMKKASSGEKVVFCTVGGSITEGSGASDGEYYGDNLLVWFKNRFPKGDFEYFNAGRGTTTSLFGVAKVERDIAPLHADLIIIEYAVNDTILDSGIAAEAFEDLLRKCLTLPENPAVFCLFCCMGSLGSAQDIELPIARHYGLPSSSFAYAMRWHLEKTFGDALSGMTEKQTEDYTVANFIFDGCHPNTFGYHMLTDFIALHLDNALTDNIECHYSLPEPLIGLRFMPSHIENNTVLKVLSNNGWLKADKDEPYTERGYTTSQPGAEIVFSFSPCRIITLVTRRSVKPTTGIITYQIDSGATKRLDGYFRDGWGTHNNYLVILDEQEARSHTVRIVFTGEKPEAHTEDCVKLGFPSENAASRFIISEFLPS